jgi:hypothetical protein
MYMPTAIHPWYNYFFVHICEPIIMRVSLFVTCCMEAVGILTSFLHDLQIFCGIKELILPSKQWHLHISVIYFSSHVTQNLLRMLTSPNFCKFASTGTALFSLKRKFTLACCMFGNYLSYEPTCPQWDTPWGQVDSCQYGAMSEHAIMWQKVVTAVKHGHSSRVLEGEAPTELEISAMVCTCHSPLS